MAITIGLALIIVPKLFDKEKEEEGVGYDTEDVTYYSEKLENKIRELICKSKGVGNATVVVSLDSTGEYVWAENESEGNGTTLGEYVIVNRDDNEETVLIKEIYPRVRGVAVVCDGGNSTEVQNRVTLLISAALGISANKIAVSG